MKEIRSVRQWSYETFGNQRAIEFTVMATPEDLGVNADIEVPGGTNNNNYANVDPTVEVAEGAGVQPCGLAGVTLRRIRGYLRASTV